MYWFLKRIRSLAMQLLITKRLLKTYQSWWRAVWCSWHAILFHAGLKMHVLVLFFKIIADEVLFTDFLFCNYLWEISTSSFLFKFWHFERCFAPYGARGSNLRILPKYELLIFKPFHFSLSRYIMLETFRRLSKRILSKFCVKRLCLMEQRSGQTETPFILEHMYGQHYVQSDSVFNMIWRLSQVGHQKCPCWTVQKCHCS